jgi:hypothetical protein
LRYNLAGKKSSTFDLFYVLSKKTRIPQAALVQEGVDLMLRKREKQLRGRQKR